MPGVIMETTSVDGSFQRQRLNEGVNGTLGSHDEKGFQASAMNGPVHVNDSSALINGKSPGNQSTENIRKKLRILDFAHVKRAEFIKLLVLSQWSRQAAEVSRLIDIQGFIRSRHQAYAAAVQVVGEMKRDLVRAQVANPDLKTALEVLSKGRVDALPDLDAKINEVLHNDGLLGCFEFLNGLVLTNKVNTLFRQAVELTQNLWADCLRIEFLHRTLVIQYWPTKPGPKSWLEIGVQRGGQGSGGICVPHLGFRWMRDGQQANHTALRFDTKNLDIERLLRSVIATHISHMLSSVFAKLRTYTLFSHNKLMLRGQLSQTEPGDCHLEIQLTSSRFVRVSVEPLSGAMIFGHPDGPRPDAKIAASSLEEILSRVIRLRCAAALEEIESGTKAIGLEMVSQRTLGLDARRLFPSQTLHTAFFTHPIWDRHWVVAATSSMDGDGWWLVRLPLQTDADRPSPSAHLIRNNLTTRHFSCTAGAELVHGLAGILAIYANARCLSGLPEIHLEPSLEKLQLGPDLEVPEVTFRYNAAMLPPALKILRPRGGRYLRDSIRLLFHGIDHASQSTVLVAYGTLQRSLKFLPSLLSKPETSLLMLSPSGVALRLLVPAGRSVTLHLFERLQRLECVLSIIQSLIEKQMTLLACSFSQIEFAYGPGKRFRARFDIDISGPSLSDHIDISHALSMADPLFRMHLRISFDSPSPHRRVQEALTVALNHRFPKVGISPTLGYMSKTFPLLQCLDQITSAPTSSLVLHVTVRGPTDFHLHYPQLRSRFRLCARPQKGQAVWLLEDSNRPPLPETGQVSHAVHEKIYNSKGDGWQGQGDGAISEVEKVGDLLSTLHACLSACPPEALRPETVVKQLPEAESTQRTTGGAPIQATTRRAELPNNPDIITID
ncbi:hypothetical protein N7468_010482 [Penicillium chermesinum]|uniref:Mediator of RNA polymerase II transcription subunit 14 n=1 Tax=Penicillium chermesinum TaxID=63820 RepID=A0A9W9T9S6_9EURO|nr:uncharacterized protein N7468_010482 [Penicillium chermesinum]KAJ5214803.1 hypothetical protein N7468_010482 [Penicillium chermesinum]